MLRKRQVLTLAGIAAISLLIGTTFNVMSMATDGGNPWDRVWKAIYDLESSGDSLNASLIELQGQVNSIEENVNRVKTVRFFEPNESSTEYVWKRAATFTWTPRNTTDNTLLSIVYYFEYRGPETQFRMDINGITATKLLENQIDYQSSPVLFLPMWYQTETYPDWIPDQPEYVIKFKFRGKEGEPAYVRNINIIITVADGLLVSD